MKTVTMSKLLFLITIILIFLQVSQAQTLDKKIIDEKLALKKNAFYVVNGLPYEQNDSIKLNLVLESYSINHIVELTKLNEEGSIVRHTNSDIAIIYFATQQPRKVIKRKLNEIENRFPDTYYGFSQHILADSKNPVLIVDNKAIHHTEAKKVIENLRTKDVFFIDYKSEPQASEFYGQNAKNGLVRIWTKQK